MSGRGPFRSRRRIVKRKGIAAVAAILVTVLAAAAWRHDLVLEKVLWWRYWRTLETPKLPPASGGAEARRDDLDHLARLPEVDRSFTAATRTEFTRRVDDLRQRVSSLDETSFLLGVAHAAAAAGNGHTQLDPATWRARLPSVPVRLAWFGNALHVVRAREEHAALLGAQVLAIAGEEPPRLLEKLAPFVSGTIERARAQSPMLLESPAVMAALVPGAAKDTLELRVREATGVERTLSLAALPAGTPPPASKPGRVMAPDVLPQEAGWRSAFEPAQVPVTLRGAQALFHSEVLAPGVLYVHPWRVSRGFDATVGRALDAALGGAHAPPWQRILLDLRLNDGGEYPMVYAALRRLPSRLAPDGRVEVLVDETTYSGAIIMAALTKHFAGPRARIVGSRAGDALAFWAEGTYITLPRSGVRIDVATGYHDWARGCGEWRCYWPNLFRGVAVGSIDQQVPAQRDFAAMARGVDPVLQAALQ